MSLVEDDGLIGHGGGGKKPAPPVTAKAGPTLRFWARSFEIGPWPDAPLAAFDPNQPRDDHGRWTDTGASDADDGTPDPAAPRTSEMQKRHLRHGLVPAPSARDASGDGEHQGGQIVRVAEALNPDVPQSRQNQPDSPPQGSARKPGTGTDGENGTRPASTQQPEGAKPAGNSQSSPSPDTPPPPGTPASIVWHARKMIKSTKYEVNSDLGGGFGVGTDKCNKFVADVLNEAGARVPNEFHSTWLHNYPPTAEDWGDPKIDIPGWVIVYPPFQPGDVISNPLLDSDGNVVHKGGTAHVGIFVGNSSAVSAPPDKPVFQNDFGFKEGQIGHMVGRRYVGSN